jgi:hypothetical protein
MKQAFTAEMDDGTAYTIEADARDIRAWEATYDRPWYGASLSFTMLAQLAHIAGQRTGVLNGAYPDYASFDAHCVDMRGSPVAVVANPTRADRTGASPVRSLSAPDASPPNSKRRARK